LNGARVGSLPVAVAGVLAAVLALLLLLVAILVLLLTPSAVADAEDENGGDRDGDGNKDGEDSGAVEAGYSRALPGKTASVRYALDLKSSSVLREGFNERKKRNRGEQNESSAQPGQHTTKKSGYVRDHFPEASEAIELNMRRVRLPKRKRRNRRKKCRCTHHNPTNAATALASASPTDAYLVFGLQNK
jgi:hypothetical protein